MPIDGSYRLETPENVEVSFELAGPGSRFCAMIIDTLLMFLIVFVLGIVACALNGGNAPWAEYSDSEDASEAGWFTWVNAILILIASLVVFGYFTFFELILGGQTPGKRSLKLRVMRDDGTPAGPLDIVIRNLVRVVDFMPGFYLVGGLASLLSPTNKRLGDMAAGTIVVKEAELDYRAQPDSKPVAPANEVAVSNAALTPEEQRLIRGFLQRRDELLLTARAELADRLAQRLFEKHAGNFDNAESYLERLAQGRHFER